ncbi:hypothetical protein [Paraburkholderia sediminicola]|uniref:hypothetical protein n=1 Tax=Paraburkholderia sediminicola TaxID=458836 RepID=UPI0038B8318D
MTPPNFGRARSRHSIWIRLTDNLEIAVSFKTYADIDFDLQRTWKIATFTRGCRHEFARCIRPVLITTIREMPVGKRLKSLLPLLNFEWVGLAGQGRA